MEEAEGHSVKTVQALSAEDIIRNQDLMNASCFRFPLGMRTFTFLS